ncbi:I78 family peptidase inhibitor [Aquipseudomonas campi]
MTGNAYIFPALFALALLTGCSSTPEKAPATATAPADQAAAEVDDTLLSRPTAKFDDRCDADGVQNLVGKTITVQLAQKARDDARASYLRVTTPNQAVTMDYNAQRLNIDTSDAGVILRINCG